MTQLSVKHLLGIKDLKDTFLVLAIYLSKDMARILSQDILDPVELYWMHMHDLL